MRVRVGMMMCDRCQLEALLLSLMGGNRFIKYNNRAIAIPRGQHEALPIRRPINKLVPVSKRVTAKIITMPYQ